MSILARFLQREKRFIKSERVAFLVLPLVLVPLLIELVLHAMIQEHSFITSMYISTVTFTTLGSGDWIPQTLPAMMAVISEVILGVVQGGVFVAIVIYAHQNKGK